MCSVENFLLERPTGSADLQSALRVDLNKSIRAEADYKSALRHRAYVPSARFLQSTSDVRCCGYAPNRKTPPKNRKQATAALLSLGYFHAMKIALIASVSVLAMFGPATVLADHPSAAASDRYGLFNWLDHRSFYNEGDYPEPFLVDDSGLEINEARLDWLRTEADGSKTDFAKAEVEKGFGLTTVELEVPYERDSSAHSLTKGFANIDLGARHPLHQLVSASGFFDNTLGVAAELGIPTGSVVSKNTELVPKIFDDAKIGEHFTAQSVLGYSQLFGPGADGGLASFEYGFVFGYTIQRAQLRLPGVLQFIPMFEFSGETQLNKADAGGNRVLGNAACRVNLKPIGRVQPRLGVGYVFPVTSAAHEDAHRGIFTSLVFEY